MIDKNEVSKIFKLYYLDNLSVRAINKLTRLHRNTISKYIKLLNTNIYSTIDDISISKSISQDRAKEYLWFNIDCYKSSILNLDIGHRQKRVLTEDIIKSIKCIASTLKSNSPTEIYEYIQENNHQYLDLIEISYSSIRRALLQD